MWNLRHQYSGEAERSRFFENECEELKDRLRFFQHRDTENGNEDPRYKWYACHCQICCTCQTTEPRLIEMAVLRENRYRS